MSKRRCLLQLVGIAQQSLRGEKANDADDDDDDDDGGDDGGDDNDY